MAMYRRGSPGSDHRSRRLGRPGPCRPGRARPGQGHQRPQPRGGAHRGGGPWAGVGVGITVANGTDNTSVYTPTFRSIGLATASSRPPSLSFSLRGGAWRRLGSARTSRSSPWSSAAGTGSWRGVFILIGTVRWLRPCLAGGALRVPSSALSLVQLQNVIAKRAGFEIDSTDAALRARPVSAAVVARSPASLP